MSVVTVCLSDTSLEGRNAEMNSLCDTGFDTFSLRVNGKNELHNFSTGLVCSEVERFCY